MTSFNETNTAVRKYRGEEEKMGASYKKLWKLLIDRDMLKGDLCRAAGISSTTMAKLGKGESVNTDILIRICATLEVDISDIMEVVPDEQSSNKKRSKRNNG